ncbi:MAG: zinc/iron-chelating domain-containing protein [Desulfovibrionaceae bacterium]|nr:zinc/iron-chelating domain-containing protein [Desulfovibrionaceae bacterium]
MTIIQHLINPPEGTDATGEALCLACARSGTCCCQTDPDLTHLSFPLSDPEWQRLLPYANLAAASPDQDDVFDQGDAIRAAEPNTPDFIASMRALFPRDKKHIELLFPPEGTHYTLRTRADGSCVFLDKNGCRLPRSARPWYCLLFPAWMVEDSLTLFMSEHCLIAQKAHSPAHGAVLLQQHPARIRELHRSLRLDWGLALHNNES